MKILLMLTILSFKLILGFNHTRTNEELATFTCQVVKDELKSDSSLRTVAFITFYHEMPQVLIELLHNCIPNDVSRVIFDLNSTSSKIPLPSSTFVIANADKIDWVRIFEYFSVKPRS